MRRPRASAFRKRPFLLALPAIDVQTITGRHWAGFGGGGICGDVNAVWGCKRSSALQTVQLSTLFCTHQTLWRCCWRVAGALLFATGLCMLLFLDLFPVPSEQYQPLLLALYAEDGRHDSGQLIDEPLTVLTNGLPITMDLYLSPVYSVSAPPPIFLPLVTEVSPLTPSQPHPPNAAINQSPNVYLAWETVDASSSWLRYDIYLEANNPQPTMLLAGGLINPYFDPPAFELDTPYYWRVAVRDPQGQYIIGPVWSFHVEPFYDPPAIGTMIKIPAGEFMMGCDPAIEDCWQAKERPLHRVYLDAYEIDKYEVTNLEYRACVEARACQPPRLTGSRHRSSYFYNPNYNYFPVMYVSQRDAKNYCEWAGKRLLTEAEWEKAARGPVDTRPWPWGHEGVSCSLANYQIHCVGDSTRVGAYPQSASPYGVMDMAGNMFEWVLDRYHVDYYTVSPYENPQGPALSRPDPTKPPTSHPYYVIRSGSYHDNWYYARVAHRHWGHHGDKPGDDAPYYRSFRVGIRCGRSLAE